MVRTIEAEQESQELLKVLNALIADLNGRLQDVPDARQATEKLVERALESVREVGRRPKGPPGGRALDVQAPIDDIGYRAIAIYASLGDVFFEAATRAQKGAKAPDWWITEADWNYH